VYQQSNFLCHLSFHDKPLTDRDEEGYSLFLMSLLEKSYVELNYFPWMEDM